MCTFSIYFDTLLRWIRWIEVWTKCESFHRRVQRQIIGHTAKCRSIYWFFVYFKKHLISGHLNLKKTANFWLCNAIIQLTACLQLNWVHQVLMHCWHNDSKCYRYLANEWKSWKQRSYLWRASSWLSDELICRTHEYMNIYVLKSTVEPSSSFLLWFHRFSTFGFFSKIWFIICTLLTVGLTASEGGTSQQHPGLHCDPTYGFIIDRNVRKNVSICGNRNEHTGQKSSSELQGQTIIHVSSSNHLQIITREDFNSKIIIRVEGLNLPQREHLNIYD